MDKSAESLGDIVEEVEILCGLMHVRFNIYDLKGSLNRVRVKLKQQKEQFRRTLSTEEEW